ncbi:MAG: polyprenyl synthetase family protein [Bacteroidales bacterium]|nr:polyprenyl synthetase family protein [Bacteroidales bacterium]
MITEVQIEETLKELFEKIEFTVEPAGLYDPLRYTIAIGGKRVRPRLCLLVYSLFKDSFDESILSPAEALEVFHTFTLLHDDIMDKSALRRGMPTVHVRWSDNTAILSGDVMSIDSYRRIAKAPVPVLPQVLELFSKTAAEVCEGQQYDMEFESLEEVPMDDYMKMIGLKTAVLIACSAKMGALIAGCDEKTCEAFYDFGYNLGLAFQIADDYLDNYADEKVFGKPIGGDILNGKKTWLLTKALEKAGGRRGELLAAMAAPAVSGEEKAAKIAVVKGIYEDLGVDEDAKYEIIRLHARAEECVAGLGLTKVRLEMLHRYADRLVGRTK